MADPVDSHGEVRIFEAGTVTLTSGEQLPDARIVYAVHGTLNEARDNAVLLPTCYGGRHEDNEYLIGPDRAIDPDRYCIIVPNKFGNGLSTSPSNGDAPFPLVTIADNVELQRRLAQEVFGIEAFQLVAGFSMGGQQAYEWASRFPEMVPRVAVLCGAARCAPHSFVFLEGIKAVLELDPDACAHGDEGPTAAKRAMSRVWAGWGLSQAWYREGRYEAAGYADLEEYLRAEWDPGFDDWDTRDLLAMLATWQNHDIGGPRHVQADYEAALSRITARAVIMPGRTDLYFPPEDCADEVAHLPNGRLAVIESVYGHQAGGGADPEDLAFITREIRALLDAPA